MERDYISTNFLEIISGSDNKTSRAYVEAAKKVESQTPKAMAQLKGFIMSIESLASKENVKDSRISGTKGNITAFDGYDNIQTAMNFLDKNLGRIDVMQNLHTIYEALKSNQAQYVEGYQKNVRLVVLEYESALYLLVTGLSMSMAENIDIVQNGLQIKIKKKSGNNDGPTIKTLREFATQLGSKTHKEYLEGLIKEKTNLPISTNIEESTTIMESAVSDTLELLDAMISNVGRVAHVGKKVVTSIKNSVFGILPLIRSALYLRYKKKADTIMALDQQVQFINMNIEQLQNMKNMDPAKKEEIIKKQKACAEKYQKKAAKLRAQLTDGERSAAEEIKKEDSKIKKVDEGDFVFESGTSVRDIYMESAEIEGEDAMTDEQKKRYHGFDEIEKEFKVKIPTSIKLGVALGSPVLYRYGSSDIPIDVLSTKVMKSTSATINKDLESRKDAAQYSKYLPVVALCEVDDGDFDVITSKGKMMYYSRNSKKALTTHGLKTEDPEEFYFVDSPSVKYSKKNKPTYVAKKD